MRPICPVCNQRPRAINCYRGQQVYYRSRCEDCIKRHKKIKPAVPRWRQNGYKKKSTCDRCGFRSRWASQLLVYHQDGNLNNSGLRNLRTVCLNCAEDLKKTDQPWRPGDLELDL